MEHKFEFQKNKDVSVIRMSKGAKVGLSKIFFFVYVISGIIKSSFIRIKENISKIRNYRYYSVPHFLYSHGTLRDTETG